MHAMGLIAALSFFPAPDQPDPVRLRLHASTTRPYVGQEVELSLDIQIKAELAQRWIAAARDNPAELPELYLPWFIWQPDREPGLELDRGMEWLESPDHWFCHRTVAGKGLPLRVESWRSVIWCEPEANGPGATAGYHTYRLRWRILVTKWLPHTQGTVGFGLVELSVGEEAYRSNRLDLALARLPIVPKTMPDLELGVGPYQLSAELDPPETRIDEPVTLTVCVRGPGNLTRMERPRLTRLEGFANTRRLTIEPAGETWRDGGNVRCFRYHLTPRTAQVSAVPAITAFYWDPPAGGRENGQYRIVQVEPIPLKVLPKANVTGPEPGPTLTADQLPERLRLEPVSNSLTGRESLWPDAWIVWSIGVGFPLLWLATAGVKFWVLPRITGAPLWSPAAIEALESFKQLEAFPLAIRAEAVYRVTAEYLRRRFGLASVEPTPSEAAAALEQTPVPAAVRERVRLFLEHCNAERFGTDKSAADLRTAAEHCIRNLDPLG